MRHIGSNIYHNGKGLKISGGENARIAVSSPHLTSGGKIMVAQSGSGFYATVTGGCSDATTPFEFGGSGKLMVRNFLSPAAVYDGLQTSSVSNYSSI